MWRSRGLPKAMCAIASCLMPDHQGVLKAGRQAPDPLLERIADAPGMGRGVRQLVVLLTRLCDFDSIG